MSLKKTFFLLFFLFSLSSLKLSSFFLPEKDKFIPLDHDSQTLIELTAENNELYFTFYNPYDSSDILIYFKNGKEYTTGIYIYDSYENIKTDENDEYSNYLVAFDLSDRFGSIPSARNTTYYIIIKDSGKFEYKDYITIFNDKDILNLKENQPFSIRKFTNNNLYKFIFNGEEDDIIYLEMNIEDKSYSETITIIKNNKEIYKEEKNTGIILLNEDKNAGTYMIEISATNNEQKNIDIKSTIVLRKSKTKVRLLEAEKTISFYYLNSNDFSFYLNMDDYEINEENIITFKASHIAYKNKLIKYCYAKNINSEKFDDELFSNNMPKNENENEAYFSRANSYDNIYHLYFSRKLQSENNKKSYLLVNCNIKIDNNDYLDPQEMCVSLSSRASLFDFSEKTKINENFNIKKYIPKLYKIKIPIEENKEDNKKSYIIYTDKKLKTVYEDSMLNSNNRDEESDIIYVISNEKLKNENGKNKILYIKIFGDEQEVNFRAEFTEDYIYYIKGNYRPSTTISYQNVNCLNSFYYIGSHSLFASDTNFFLEEIYGKYDIYYKNEISDNDDTLLTNRNSKYLLNSKMGGLTKHFDILELKCKTPGYFNLHILKSYLSQTLSLYQRQIAILDKGTYSIKPKLDAIQNRINMELSTPLGKEIQIEINNVKNIINSEQKYFQKQYDISEFPIEINLFVKEDNTIISSRLTDSYLYQIVEDESLTTDKENILFKLKNEKTYKSVDISIKGNFKYYTYTLFKGDENYAIKLSSSGYQKIPISGNNFYLTFSNPYLKVNQMISDKEDSLFYIAFNVGNNKDITFKYNNIEQYEDIEYSTIKTIWLDNNKKYHLGFANDIEKVNILYQGCGNSLKQIDLYSYDDVLDTFENKNKINLASINNYLIPEHIKPIFNNVDNEEKIGAQISISLKEISQNEIDNLNNGDFKISQNGKTLNWTNIEGVKDYTIYVFNSKNENVKYIQNICYLDSIKNTDLLVKDEKDSSYIGISITNNNFIELKEEGNYIVTVVANLDNRYPLKLCFKEIKYEYKSNKQDDNNGGKNLAIIIGISIPLIIIIIVILVVILVKIKKNKVNRNIPSEEEPLGPVTD